MRKIILLIIISLPVCTQPIVQVKLDANNISSWILNTGIFNQDRRISNAPGFEWPKGSGKTAIFTSGLTIAAYVNNVLRMAAASYKGEYVPGYSSNGVFHTDSRFKFYIIRRGDNYINNPSWLNWGLMIPYGAPYVDVNNNGTYEYFADTPGVRSAAQTIFICLTDGDPSHHYIGEGFGGGTPPLFSEVHMTAWAYDNPGYGDMQFFKWEVINKNIYPWTRTYFSIYSDPDLGFSSDDYIGCDTTRNLAYCYNADNNDGDGGTNTYGANPPAVGIAFLNCLNSEIIPTSAVYIANTGTPGPFCEKDANGEALGAYNFMRGVKKDLTPWVIPNTNPPRTTKFCYSGDPESGTGWTEFGGSIQNCGGLLTGNYVPVNPSGNGRNLLSYGNDNLTINVNDTVRIIAVQLIARGTNHLNSVTKLKQLTDVARQLCQNGFVIGINPISSEIPNKFNLYQNYPNPFNPITKIRFQIPLLRGVDVPGTRDGRGVLTKLTIYDALGREITTLINEQLQPGTYSVDWNGANYPSGVYFYKLVVSGATPLQTESYSQTRKMVLLK